EGCTLATRIGAGTLGVVYRGRDAAGKEAAVKLLDPGLREDAGAVARFVAGARAQLRVTHPNVVRMLAVAQVGLPAAVLEWAAGGAADGRANQFSLGALMLHALTGKPPFGSGTRAEIAQVRVAGSLPPLRASLPEATVALERLLARLLARAPAHRFESWAEVR